MVVNTLIYGFITWLPTFFVGQGESIARSTGFALLMAVGGPIGSTMGAISADTFGRKPTIIGAAASAILLCAAFSLSDNSFLTAAIGFLLTIPIYVLVAALFAVYVPELFPTEFRLRGVGICNAAGRSASIIVPLFVGPVFAHYGVSGVLAIMGVALLIMIGVVASLGIEPGRNGIEEVSVAA
jgi:putative MFS transporter